MEDLVDRVVCSHNANIPETQRATPDLRERQNYKHNLIINNNPKQNETTELSLILFKHKDKGCVSCKHLQRSKDKTELSKSKLLINK